MHERGVLLHCRPLQIRNVGTNSRSYGMASMPGLRPTAATVAGADIVLVNPQFEAKRLY